MEAKKLYDHNKCNRIKLAANILNGISEEKRKFFLVFLEFFSYSKELFIKWKNTVENELILSNQ